MTRLSGRARKAASFGREEAAAMLRGRRERREERRGGDQRVHYQMRQRLVSIGDDYWIETDTGQRAYKVDGKALRLRKTLIFEDSGGHKLAKIQERVARIRDSMEIEDADGHQVAMVKKALITHSATAGPSRSATDPTWTSRATSSTTSTRSPTGAPRWPRCRGSGSRVADSYGVEIAPDQDPVVLLAATVAVDTMAYEGR
jgi:uncharacterized protein YxjI